MNTENLRAAPKRLALAGVALAAVGVMGTTTLALSSPDWMKQLDDSSATTALSSPAWMKQLGDNGDTTALSTISLHR